MSPPWGARHMPRAAEVSSLYSNKGTKATIARAVRLKHGDQIWQLILAAIDAGFVKKNHYGLNGTIGSPLPLRVLFPNEARRKGAYICSLNLIKSNDLQYVQSIIFPIALANRDALIANPHCLEQLVQDRLASFPSSMENGLIQPPPAPPPVIIKQTESETVTETITKTVTRTKTVEITLDPIIMFDFVLWPRPITSLPYTWEQARAATWLFRDMHVLAELGGKPGLTAKAMHLRFALRAWRGRADERVLTLIKGIISAMEFNPNGKCEWPIKPLREEW